MVASPSSGFPPRPARSRSIDENDILADRQGMPRLRRRGSRFLQNDQPIIPWRLWFDKFDWRIDGRRVRVSHRAAGSANPELRLLGRRLP